MLDDNQGNNCWLLITWICLFRDVSKEVVSQALKSYPNDNLNEAVAFDDKRADNRKNADSVCCRTFKSHHAQGKRLFVCLVAA